MKMKHINKGPRLLVVSQLRIEGVQLDENKNPLHIDPNISFKKVRFDPETVKLETLVIDPNNRWSKKRLNLEFPGIFDSVDSGIDYGDSVISGVGDIDGDGRNEIVCAITRRFTPARDVYVMSFKLEAGIWIPSAVSRNFGDVEFIRSISIGDVDEDGMDEIVIGTRPNGLILLLDRLNGEYKKTIIGSKHFGKGTTYTREVLISDVNNDGIPEILVTTAIHDKRGDWIGTPGYILMYSKVGDKWQSTLIEDFGGQTHSRMIAVGNLKGDGKNYLASNHLGISNDLETEIDPKSAMYSYAISKLGVEKEFIGELDNAIKARGVAIGDIDGDGLEEVIVGTRTLHHFGCTFLYCYKYHRNLKTWSREILDTSTELGFHTVCVADVDGDGRDEVIASDDAKGLIKMFKKVDEIWKSEVILDYPHPIFCTSINLFS